MTISSPAIPVSLDDSLLDRLASQVRANPPLGDEAVADLLAAARRHDSGDPIVILTRHHLSLALDAALALRGEDDDVAELFQEGSVAVCTAVADYIAGSGDAAGLRDHVRGEVDAHIAGVQSGERRRREEQEAFVRDSRMLDLAEVEMRHRLGRPATVEELAKVLEWTPRRVELVGEMLDAARRLDDETLIPFLDDDSDEDADEAPDRG